MAEEEFGEEKKRKSVWDLLFDAFEEKEDKNKGRLKKAGAV